MKASINDTTASSAAAWPGLDDVDLVLIRALQHDGRASLASMAKTVGLSVTTVRQRHERLVQRGLVCAVAVVDPVALGRQVIAHIDLTVRGDVRAVCDRLQDTGQVAWMAIGADYRTIRLQVSTSTHADLVHFLNSQVRTIPEIVQLSTKILLRNWSPVFNFGDDVQAPADAAAPSPLWHGGTQPIRPLDELDRSMLHSLEQDARVTITAMSEHVGLSVPATRQRLVKLLKEGTVRIRTRPTPVAEGITAVGLVVEFTGDSTVVAEALADMPNVSYVLESTGPAVLNVELICALEEQVAEAHQRAHAIPGVLGVQVARYGEVVVHSGHW